MAMVARLGLDTFRTTLDGVIGDLFGVFAMRAGNAHQVPFGGTQRATQIAATVSLPPDMHHTGNGHAAAKRANTISSEERRVGKECVITVRSRGSQNHKKQNTDEEEGI